MFKWLFKAKQHHPNVKCSNPKTLCDACEGDVVRIECLKGDTCECQRLREMGFCEKAKIQKIAHTSALVCKVCDSKVVISEGLAENVIICQTSGMGEVSDEHITE